MKKNMKYLISKKGILGTLAMTAVCTILGTEKASAQEFSIQGDVVSSYVWRGVYQGGGASFQPTLGFSAGNFSLTAWGSTSFSEDKKEIDLTAAYKFGEAGPTLSVASLWWAGQGVNKYFHLESHETDHHFEAGLAYTLPVEKFPLSVAWYTMFAGADKKMSKEGEVRQNYSSYLELNYPFIVRSVDMNATVGMLPYQAGYNNDGSSIYSASNSGFAVTNVALKATKVIKINDKFSFPVFAHAIWNPRMEDAHLVFGITLRP